MAPVRLAFSQCSDRLEDGHRLRGERTKESSRDIFNRRRPDSRTAWQAVVEGNPKQLNTSGLRTLTLPPPETIISLAFANAISLKSQKTRKKGEKKYL